jgi:hypothetical protein
MDENGKPFDVRIAFNLTAGSLTWRRSVRPAGATEDNTLRNDSPLPCLRQPAVGNR